MIDKDWVGTGDQQVPPPLGLLPASWAGKYQFTVDWFRYHIDHWNKFLVPWRQVLGQPFAGLEIGCYEAMSTVWLLENMLTGPQDHLTTIDFYDGLNGETWRVIYERARRNILTTCRDEQHKFMINRSSSALSFLHSLPGRYNFIYVDGSHKESDVYYDCICAYQLLQPGGLILWDDWFTPDKESREGVRAALSRFFKEKNLEIRFMGAAVFAVKS